MKWVLLYINILLIIIVTFLSYFLHSYGTDYEEYNELYKCINNPSLCPLEISIYNYSYGERVFMKMTSWIGSFFLVELFVIYFTMYQLYLLAKAQKLNYSYILTAFFLAFLKDYYLNAFAQALSLSFILFSFNIISKKKKVLIRIISTFIHFSSAIFLFKIGKKYLWIVFTIIFFNLILFVFNESIFKSLIDNLPFDNNFIFNKIKYYLNNKSIGESYFSLFLKTLIFLFVCSTKYLKESRYLSIYIVIFMLYTSFLSLDIVANRILSIGKIFEILAFASLLNIPYQGKKFILSFTYLTILLVINFL